MAFAPASKAASVNARLSAFSFVADLEESALTRLQDSVRAKHFAQDTRIVRYGDDCPFVPLVERGVIRVTKGEGRDLLLYDIGPGEACVLALTSALRSSRYPAEAMAVAGADVLLVPAEELRAVFAEDTSMQAFVVEAFTRRVTDLMALAEGVVFEPLPVRLAALLLRQAAAQGPGALEGRVLRLTHAELAAMLGTAREVVSRSLDAMQAAGVVALGRRRIEILDAAGLSAFSKR